MTVTIQDVLNQARNIGSMDVAPLLKKPVVTLTSDLDYDWDLTVSWADASVTSLPNGPRSSAQGAITDMYNTLLSMREVRRQTQDLYDLRYAIVRPYIEKLKEVMLDVAATQKSFNMCRVIYQNDPVYDTGHNVHFSALKDGVVDRESCNTSACCLGWYCVYAPVGSFSEYEDYSDIIIERFAPYHGWLFSPNWESNVSDALLRIQAVLDNGCDTRLITPFSSSEPYGIVNTLQRKFLRELRAANQVVSTDQ